MVTHYFTLQALLEEFQPALSGSTVEEIFSQRKNELIISFKSTSLVISIDPQLNFIVLRERVTRARKNSVDLFEDFVGTSITSFRLHLGDRTFQSTADNGLTLNIQLYNSASSNIILTDDKNSILDAFKGNKEKKGKQFAIENKEFDRRLFEDENLFGKTLRSDAKLTIFAALKQTIPVLGAQFAKELLVRADIDTSQLVDNLSSVQIQGLHRELGKLITSLKHPAPVIYVRENGVKIFSVMPLQSMHGIESNSYSGTNSAVLAFLTSSFRAKGKDAEKKEILQKLEAELKRVQRSLTAVTTQLEEGNRAEEYERKGKLLLANISGITKGMREITVEDLGSGNSLEKIVLNPMMSPSLNAEQYFEKAKKSKIAQKESAERRIGLENTRANLERIIHVLTSIDSTEEFREFKREFEKDLLAMKMISPPKGEELPPFRIFTVSGDYQVWVGKSSANNDLLTMKYAKPNDLWFHVRGASGSHTVLKVKSGAEPPKEAVREAAAIAAYYSKMRNAGNVPVAYCERKFVRKPKGLATGAVFLEREKTIFVKPGLP